MMTNHTGGAALHVGGRSTVWCLTCTFSQNTAAEGAAVYIESTAHFIQSTFSENIALSW
jgi:hypothetical protein